MIFHILMLCISVTTTGIPMALSSLISQEKSINNKHKISILFIAALYIVFFASSLLSIVLLFFSKYISLKLFNTKEHYDLICLIVPAISLISLSNILRSYYYGIRKVLVPAFGQVLEQISRIAFIYLIFSALPSRVSSPRMPLLAVSIGEFINIIFILINIINEPILKREYVKKFSQLFSAGNTIIKIGLPGTVNRLVTVAIQSLSSIMIPSRLVLSGISHEAAIGNYGVLTGMVFPFLFLPFTLTSALSINLIPSISKEIPSKNHVILKAKIKCALIISMFIGMICTIFLMVFGNKICFIAFKNTLAGQYLQVLSISTIFMVLNQTLTSILHSIGEEYITSINNIIGLVFQLLCIYFIIPIKSFQIYGFIIGYILSSIITFILNCFSLHKAQKRWA